MSKKRTRRNDTTEQKAQLAKKDSVIAEIAEEYTHLKKLGEP